MFSPMDVNAMETDLQPQILDAIAMIETARAWLGETKLIRYTALATILRCRMEVRLVMHVHGFAKEVDSLMQFASI